MNDQANNGAGIIDMHAHWFPNQCVSEVIGDAPGFSTDRSPDGRQHFMCGGHHVISLPRDHDDMQARLAVMDQAGVSIQVLSLGDLDLGWAGSRAAAAARRINDGMAAVCRRSGGRLRFVAALAIEDPKDRVDELDRAMSMGAVGVGITTTRGGKSLDAPEFRGFWQEAGKRELLVLIHPTFPCSLPSAGPSGDRGEFLISGFLAETGMAASKIVLAGILEECAGVRVVWSHLGGSLAMLMDRLDRAYKRFEKCPRPPSVYFKRCFFDTVCAHGPALDCAHATFGPDCLVFGSDEPFVPNGTRNVLAALRARPWATPDIEAVLTGNAQRLGIR